jgi:hypothetical protein
MLFDLPRVTSTASEIRRRSGVAEPKARDSWNTERQGVDLAAVSVPSLPDSLPVGCEYGTADDISNFSGGWDAPIAGRA